jgi:hypothetical protein
MHRQSNGAHGLVQFAVVFEQQRGIFVVGFVGFVEFVEFVGFVGFVELIEFVGFVVELIEFVFVEPAFEFVVLGFIVIRGIVQQRIEQFVAASARPGRVKEMRVALFAMSDEQ